MKKLTDKVKKDILNAFKTYTGSGVPEETLAYLMAKHAIALLEIADELPEWFEVPEWSEKDNSK